ncbi:hypothetical protein C499_16407 [Halogeometricum borinquense DSM 11551]|uniref:Uncharacterized protein n=1 Tax=Halogeometricum borinquense (strain ATCC 700274 / DSM 11551 / JCM 10706 / KCTC 4070 / PR3) TaxID=469382 RepID=E4NRC6_HALBP|nr:hypothetical protein Hbor_24080 [Halogeometricum borinquense DSM 11551]ELY24113.1 hypothetical protein C499_16407 [Halogeometricum borinquense DSM 11551]
MVLVGETKTPSGPFGLVSLVLALSDVVTLAPARVSPAVS